MNYSPATTRRGAFIACHPEIPLYDVDDSRYVDLTDVRGGESLVRSIALAIEWAETPDFHQQLVTGHPGCGKSTELYRLNSRFAHFNDQFPGLHFDPLVNCSWKSDQP